MGFIIQASDPLIWDQSNVEVEDFWRAFRKVFEEYTEDAFLIWNDIPVRLTYEYDIYLHLDSILILLEGLLNSEEGTFKLGWHSDESFITDWDIKWANNNIDIKSQWISISGGYEDLLNSRNHLELPIHTFLCEWKMLLKKVINAINQSGIVISNKDEFDFLCKIESGIKNPGYLYVVVDDEESTSGMLELKAVE
jgi:hypothetical protein